MGIQAWGTRPLFITSTFRDMHAERDHLRNVVFPNLEERLKQRRHHLEPIDLRWGVETVDESDAQAKELLVLKVCLSEVERSRPFFIGLIGDRYGWIPPAGRMQAAAQEAGFKGEVVNRSVTDLEIDFGVLSQPEQKQRCFFYLRDPLPYDQMPAEIIADYCEKEPAGVEKLKQLKARLTQALPDRVKHYHADWDHTNNVVIGLEAWGQQVLADLWHEFDQETKSFADQGEPTWQEQECFALEQFVEERARGFIGRHKSLDHAIAIATSAVTEGQTWGLCITGQPGAGKSALFSKLYREFEAQDDLFILAHAAGISPSSTQVDKMLRRWIDELAEELNVNDPIPEKAKPKDLEQIFLDLLSDTSAKQRVVVLIDALNQFSPRRQHLTSLPKLWPDNVRLIATTIPGTRTETLLQRDGVAAHDTPLLSETEGQRHCQ